MLPHLSESGYTCSSRCRVTGEQFIASKANLRSNSLIQWLIKPKDSILIHKSSPIIPILSRTSPIPHIYDYFFKICSNIVFPSMNRASYSQTTGPVVFQILTCKKVESIWHLSFQEERLNMNWNGDLDSSRQVIWRSEVRFPVQVHIFLLKNRKCRFGTEVYNNQASRYSKFV